MAKASSSNVLVTILGLLLISLVIEAFEDLPNAQTQDSRSLKFFDQFERISNPKNDCHPNMNKSSPLSGPQLFINVECDAEGARWDYSYQVNDPPIHLLWNFSLALAS